MKGKGIYMKDQITKVNDTQDAESLKGMTEAPAPFKLRKQGNYDSSRRMIGIRDLYQLLCSIVSKCLADTKDQLSIQLKVTAG